MLTVRYCFVAVSCLLVSIAVAQYSETKHPFKGIVKLDDGGTFKIQSLRIANFKGSPYVEDLRLIDQDNSNKRQLPMASIVRIDFIPMEKTKK